MKTVSSLIASPRLRPLAAAVLSLGAMLAAPALSGAAPPTVGYHGGPVMRRSTTYAIFWLPAGTHFEPAGSDTRYENRVRSFLRDVGDTSYYNILTEYSKNRGAIVRGGPIENAS